MAHRDKLWSLCALLSSRGGEPDDMRRQIMVILHTFSLSGDNRVRWHAETNYGHSVPFCHPEAASPMTSGDKLWSFRTPFHHSETIVSDGTQRQIMVILHPFVIQRRRARWHAETNYGHSAHLFAIQTKSCLMARRDKLWSFCAFCHPEAASPMTWGDTIMVIRAFRQSRGTNSTVSGWCWSFDADHFQIFAGSAGVEIERPNGVSLERN